METNIKITSHESFLQEFENLLETLNENINELAQFAQNNMHEPSLSISKKITRLKYHRKKINMMLKAYGNASEQEWFKVRDEAQLIFTRAQQEWLQPFGNKNQPQISK